MIRDTASPKTIEVPFYNDGLLSDDEISATGFGQNLSVPAGFRWDFKTYPISIQFGNRAVFNERNFIPAAVWNAPLATAVFHVDPVNGLDTNTGIGTYYGDFTSQPLKSINRAFTLGNATGAPYQVLDKGGQLYTRTLGLHAVAANVFPTQPVALINLDPNNKTVIFPGDSQTWADDGTSTGTYSTTRASTSRVVPRFNDTRTTLKGGRIVSTRTEYVKLADEVAVRASTGINAWAQVGSLVYVKLANRAVVNDTNTLCLLSAPVCQLNATTKDFYVVGFDFVGGTTNSLDATYTATRNIVAVNCTWAFPNTTAGTTGNSVAVDNMTGIACFVNCGAYEAPADAFNGHQTAGDVHFLTVNCWSTKTGYLGATSANSWTQHEGVRALDVNGNYGYNRGGTVRSIDNSSNWLVGTKAYEDQGDASGLKVSFRTDGNAIMYLDGIVGYQPYGTNGQMISTAGNGRISTRNCQFLGVTVGNIGTH